MPEQGELQAEPEVRDIRYSYVNGDLRRIFEYRMTWREMVEHQRYRVGRCAKVASEYRRHEENRKKRIDSER